MFEEGYGTSTYETTFPDGMGIGRPPNCWYPRYSGDRESVERKKQRKTQKMK